jgi:hypothetical protein
MLKNRRNSLFNAISSSATQDYALFLRYHLYALMKINLANT